MKFNCPHCQYLLKVPDNSAGRTGTCPKCHNKVRVPSIISAGHHANQDNGASSRSGSSGSAMSFCGGVLVTVMVLFALFVFMLLKDQFDGAEASAKRPTEVRHQTEEEEPMANANSIDYSRSITIEGIPIDLPYDQLKQRMVEKFGGIEKEGLADFPNVFMHKGDFYQFLDKSFPFDTKANTAILFKRRIAEKGHVFLSSRGVISVIFNVHEIDEIKEYTDALIQNYGKANHFGLGEVRHDPDSPLAGLIEWVAFGGDIWLPSSVDGSIYLLSTLTKMKTGNRLWTLGFYYFNKTLTNRISAHLKLQTKKGEARQNDSSNISLKDLCELGCHHLKDGNEFEAVKCFRKAAESGYADGQFFLACCYNFGQGVSKDRAEAVKWLRKAAAQGHEEAKVMLLSVSNTMRYESGSERLRSR